MTSLLVVLLLNSSPGVHLLDTPSIRLAGSLSQTPPEHLQLTLEDHRPSFGGAVALISAGALLGTAGSGGLTFGMALIAFSGGSFYSGLAVFLGVMIGGVGLLVLGAGIACMVGGIKMLEARSLANEQLPDVHPEPEEIRKPDPEDTGAPQVQLAPTHLITLASF